jgi:hypothetical protein
MIKPKYYRDGREIDERSALDGNGQLRDGVTAKVPMWMADAARWGGKLEAKPLITDAYGNGGVALQRPGYRISSDDSRRQVVEDAYQEQERWLTNRWRACD